GEAFAEFATRAGDYAIVAAACRVEVRPNGSIQTIRLGFCGVNERPSLAKTDQTHGQQANEALAADVANAAAASIETVSDFHATAAFRSNLVKVLGTQVLQRAFTMARRDPVH